MIRELSLAQAGATRLVIAAHGTFEAREPSEHVCYDGQVSLLCSREERSPLRLRTLATDIARPFSHRQVGVRGNSFDEEAPLQRMSMPITLVVHTLLTNARPAFETDKCMGVVRDPTIADSAIYFRGIWG